MKNYEISVWDIVINSDNRPEERKLALIGSDTMRSQSRALEPYLVEKSNGDDTFSFKMYYRYYDNILGEKVINPFISLLQNERIIKLKKEGKWYTFIIKSIQKDSNNKTLSYSCKSIYGAELGRSGFNIEFNKDLQNNQGTIEELVNKTLEGSGWELSSSSTIREKVKETLIPVTLSRAITATQVDTGTTENFSSGAIIYVFYSAINEEFIDLQFLKSIENKEKDSNVVLDKPFIYNCTRSETTNSYIFKSGTNTVCEISKNPVVASAAGERYVQQKKMEYIPVLKRNCYVTTENSTGKVFYYYTTSEFYDPTVVVNLVTNPSNFTSVDGWRSLNTEEFLTFTFDSVQKTTFLNFKANISYINSGIRDNFIYLPTDGIYKGQEFCVRIKAKNGTSIAPLGTGVKFGFYKTEGEVFYPSTLATLSLIDNSNYPGLLRFTSPESWGKNDVRNLNFVVSLNSDADVYSVEVFPLIKGGANGELIIEPNNYQTQALSEIYYKYFSSDYKNYLNKDDIVYAYVGTSKPAGYTDQITNNFEKIRSIEIKESNRFNILQTLAETFECWILPDIYYEEGGAIQTRRVKIVEDIGIEIPTTFKYGQDLQSIKRSVVSEQITTKTLVLPNQTEVAEDGLCEIARSILNPSRENYILNFDYYTSRGILDPTRINSLLFTSYKNNKGYYTLLREINIDIDKTSKEIVNYKSELDRLKSLETVIENNISSLNNIIANQQADLNKYLGNPENFETAAEALYNQEIKDTYFNNNYEILKSNQKSLENLNAQLSSLQSTVSDISNLIETRETYLYGENNDGGKVKEKRDLISEFEEILRAYITEGVWAPKSYYDNDLFYLDGVNVSYDSAFPKVSYTISVIRIAALEEFKNKIFNLGDICWVEDKEFFGDQGTTGKEQVVITEIHTYLDSPEKDSFKVQNYRTKFEDLFQQITATTQSLQYSSDQYKQLSSLINTDGTINSTILNLSIANNNNIVNSSQNNLIISDDTGITVSDITNPANKTKITAGGIFITTDGGLNWTNAINGSGIAANAMRAGVINTELLQIMSGSAQTFRWDSRGITAYKTYEEGEGDEKRIYASDPKHFVRFDKNGIYGIKNFTLEENADINTIVDNAIFSLTWNGFQMNSSAESGATVKVNSNGFFITKGSQRILSLGAIDNLQTGLEIYNTSNLPALTATVDGIQLSGEINATGGNIGGFSISNNNMISTENRGKDIPISEETASLVLNGNTGEITAKSGKIGGFTIENNTFSTDSNTNASIKIGEDDTNNIFISHFDGIPTIRVGKTTITSESIASNKWTITPESATFANVTAKGGTIENVVFKTISAQAVGGLMMFKESAFTEATKIITDDTGARLLEATFEIDSGIEINGDMVFKVNDYVLIQNGKQYKVGQINSITKDSNEIKIIIKPKISNDFNSVTGQIAMIKLASKNTENEIVDNLLIGINSATPKPEGGYENNDMGIYRGGLTVSEITGLEENGTSYNLANNSIPRVFLGDLSSLNLADISNLSGFGLYSDNVFLRGSLITKGTNSTYAGVTTGDTIKIDAKLKKLLSLSDSDSVVFFGGAASVESLSDDNVSFIVTKEGVFYANKGYFTGSVFVNSELKVATIEGGGNKGALTILDTAKGIIFGRRDADENIVEDLYIKNSGILIPIGDNQEEILSISENKNITLSSNNFKIKNNKLQFYKSEARPVLTLDDERVIVNNILSLNNKVNFVSVENGCDIYFI